MPISEQTPLLSSCCSKKQSCCSNKASESACCSSNKTSAELPTSNEDDDFCYLSKQKWQYKLVALSCAIFLAGKKKEKKER
jgi:hypothetical protein